MHDDFKIEKGSLGHITKSRNISGSPIKLNMFLQNINKFKSNQFNKKKEIPVWYPLKKIQKVQ